MGSNYLNLGWPQEEHSPILKGKQQCSILYGVYKEMLQKQTAVFNHTTAKRERTQDSRSVNQIILWATRRKEDTYRLGPQKLQVAYNIHLRVTASIAVKVWCPLSEALLPIETDRNGGRPRRRRGRHFGTSSESGVSQPGQQDFQEGNFQFLNNRYRLL